MRDRIASIYEEFHKHHGFSGAGLVKDGNGVIYSGAFGYAHRGFKVPNSIHTMFDTASVTKLFTAAAILQLVDEKRLKLDDRIMQVVDLKGTKIPDDITIAHLLTHTSGISDDADEESGEKYEELFITKPNYSIRSCKDFIPQFAYKEPLFKAGTGVRYNNCAFVLLGLAVERLTGQSYQDYVTGHVFNKCKMENTAFISKDDSDANIAEGYYDAGKDKNGLTLWRKNIYSYPPVGTADGGAFASASDLDLFIRSLKDGVLLSDEMTEAVFKPHCSIEIRTGRGKVLNGFGFHFLYDDNDKLIRIYKEGQNAGAAAMLAYYPDMDATSIVLANQTCNVWKLHNKVEEVLLGK